MILMDSTWTHDALAEDLAAHLRGNADRMIWTDMQLGPSGSPRPDVYALQKTYTRFQPLAYEIKVSVSDYRSDVTAGKWQAYLKYASGVYFAAPAGLIAPSALPAGCGLVVRGPAGWRALKKPTLRQIETLPIEAWLKLVIDGVRRAVAEERPRLATAWQFASGQRSRLAADVAMAVQDLQGVRAYVESERERARGIVDLARKQVQAEADVASEEARELRALRDEVCEVLGLPPGSTTRKVKYELARAREPVMSIVEALLPAVGHLHHQLKKLQPVEADA